jgi:sugar lactone lactonase YvrE
MLAFRKVVSRVVVLAALATFLVTGAYAADYYLLVTSQGTDSVERYDGVTGAYIDQMVLPGAGGLDAPRNLAISPHDGNLYVSSLLTSSVKRFNYGTGVYISDFVTGRTDANVMRFGPDGDLYVATNRDSQIYRYNGTTGVLAGGFLTGGGVYEVNGFAWSSDGTLYVSSRSDTDSLKRILRYNGTTGAFIDVFRSFAGEPGDNGYPGNITFGPDGNLYVVKPYAQRVERLDKTTGLTTAMTGYSGGELSTPTGLTFGPDGSLYVASADYNQIVRYNGSTLAYTDVFVPQYANGELTLPIDLTFTSAGPVEQPGNIEGTIQLQDYSPVLPMKTSVRIDLIQSGSIVRTEHVVIDSSGSYSITQINPPGTYDVAFKAASWLRKIVTGVVVPSGGTKTGVDASLISGDLDGDNALTSTDLSVVLSNKGLLGQ